MPKTTARIPNGTPSSIPPTSQTRDTNHLTKVLYERINAAGEIFLTSSVVKGIYSIRVVSANERADEAHLRRAFEILVEGTEAVVSEAK